jgi:hypothetical protein
MNAKGFFYICAGILLLVIAATVRSQAVNAQGNDFIAAVSPDGSSSMSAFALRSDGEVMRIGYGNGAVPTDAYPNPPVPVSEISYWNPSLVITTSGALWGWDAGWPDGQWRNFGQVPPPVVSTTAQSWSTMKRSYKK